VTICDIWDGHKMSQIRICDLGHTDTLWICLSFCKNIDLVLLWSQMSQMNTNWNATSINLILFLF